MIIIFVNPICFILRYRIIAHFNSNTNFTSSINIWIRIYQQTYSPPVYIVTSRHIESHRVTSDHIGSHRYHIESHGYHIGSYRCHIGSYRCHIESYGYHIGSSHENIGLHRFLINVKQYVFNKLKCLGFHQHTINIICIANWTIINQLFVYHNVQYNVNVWRFRSSCVYSAALTVCQNAKKTNR